MLVEKAVGGGRGGDQQRYLRRPCQTHQFVHIAEGGDQSPFCQTLEEDIRAKNVEGASLHSIEKAQMA